MPKSLIIDFEPVRFALFVIDRLSSHPIRHLPVYCEIVAPTIEPPVPPPPDERFLDAVMRALSLSDRNCDGSPACRNAVLAAARAALSKVLAPTARNRLANDPEESTLVLAEVVRNALELARVPTLNGLSADELQRLLEQALARVAERQDIEKLNQPSAVVQPVLTTHPLGLLATDHVGYLSFDLERQPAPVLSALAEAMTLLRAQPDAQTPGVSIWVYPNGVGGARFDALAQRRFTHDAVVMRLELDMPVVPPEIANLGVLSLQNPGLTDWRLSPASFASNPSALVGADGCETFLPANLATHEFNFHQVVGVSAGEVDLSIDPAAADKVRPGFVNEYRVSLVPIGHSLGQVLYSFPLAPGESVNFAVLDWTRRDTAQRTEATKLDESLVHELRRDRMISEIVHASIDEWQRGGSIMGGQASSAGGALGSGGMGVAAGASNAIGGAYSTTNGSRDIAADTVQHLSDNVAQAATSARELNSTVVVQTSQSEHEAIETRTVVNYNHSHTLTILYYEVLRHFRLVTEFVRQRPALLTNIHGGIAFVATDPDGAQHDDIWWPSIYENRKLMEGALLDDRYREGLDIVERRRHNARIAEVVGPLPAAPAGPVPPLGPEFRFFIFELQTGGFVPESDEDVHVSANLDLNAPPWFISLAGGGRISPPGAFFDKGHTYWFVTRTEPPTMRTIPWGSIEAVSMHVHLSNWNSDSYMSFAAVKVRGVDLDGKETVLFEKAYEPSAHLIFDNDMWFVLPTHRPAPLGRPAAEIEEAAKFLEFREHLLNRRAHYERALRLGAPPAQRAFELAKLGVGGGASLLEKIDNRPLEVLGDFVAYPCIDPDWSDKIMGVMVAHEPPDVPPIERLVTLPSRGVFAEAKLGHCNASEEIDNTRFWDWQQSPIPHLAPEIAPVQPVTPQVVTPEGLTPTPFPASLLNIVNPPSAPDPQGMASVMTALATASIFRDMSGRAEVTELLKKLSDNSVAIAGVAQKAAPPAAGSGGGGGSSGNAPASNGSSGGGSGSSTPTQPSKAIEPQQARAADLDDEERKLKIARAELAPSDQKKVREDVTKKLTTPAPKLVEIVFRHSHSLSGQPLDGDFSVIVTGGKQDEYADYSASLGVGKVSLPLSSGDYVVAITGRRTKLPAAVATRITVPAVGNHGPFDVDLSKQLSPKEIELSGNGKLNVAPGVSRVVVSVVANEQQSAPYETEVDYAREQGVELQAEFGIGAKLKDIDLGSVKFGGTSVDKGTNTNHVKVSIIYTFLTKGLAITQ